MNRVIPRVTLRPVLALAVLAGLSAATTAWAVPGTIPKHVVPLRVMSGDRVNPGGAPGVVFRREITVPDASWVRLEFGRVRLPDGSFVRITSRLDGSVQVLDARDMAAWHNTSAYFNGGAVLLELVAGGTLEPSSVTVTAASAGVGHATPFSRQVICNADDRATSANNAVARLITSYGDLKGDQACTGWITDKQAGQDPKNRCMLSAGHCFSNPQVVIAQFNVPATGIDCNIVHPPAQDQYPIVQVSFRDNGTGDDWAVFVCSTSLGKFAYERQGAQFSLVNPVNNKPTRVIGYGASGSPAPCACAPAVATDPLAIRQANAKHHVQQSADGQVSNYTTAGAGINLTSTITHTVNTCAGNSGSPITDQNRGMTAIGIHTAGACDATDATVNSNVGTGNDNARLAAAVGACVNSGVTSVAVSNVLVDPSDGGVELSWMAFTDVAASFEVMRADAIDGPYAAVSPELPGGPQTGNYSFLDASAEPGHDYFYKLGYRQSGSWSFSPPVEVHTSAAELAFRRVSPNPSTGSVRVDFDLARAGDATLELFDVNGARVRTLVSGRLAAGAGSVEWDGRTRTGAVAPAGTYFLRLTASGRSVTRKLVRLP